MIKFQCSLLVILTTIKNSNFFTCHFFIRKNLFQLMLCLFFLPYALAHNKPQSMNLNWHASIILQHCLSVLSVLCTTSLYRYNYRGQGSYIWRWPPPAARSSSQRPVLIGQPVCRAPLSLALVRKICRTHWKLKINAPFKTEWNCFLQLHN